MWGEQTGELNRGIQTAEGDNGYISIVCIPGLGKGTNGIKRYISCKWSNLNATHYASGLYDADLMPLHLVLGNLQRLSRLPNLHSSKRQPASSNIVREKLQSSAMSFLFILHNG